MMLLMNYHTQFQFIFESLKKNHAGLLWVLRLFKYSIRKNNKKCILDYLRFLDGNKITKPHIIFNELYCVIQFCVFHHGIVYCGNWMADKHMIMMNLLNEGEY